MEFLKNLASADNDTVNTPYVIGVFIVLCLATPVAMLSMSVVVNHIFLNHQKLDSPTVQLLLGLLGAATGGIASALLSKGSWSQMTTRITSMGGSMPGLNKPKVDNPEGEA